MSVPFDPEKVETYRWPEDGGGYLYVSKEDYDNLLSLYYHLREFTDSIPNLPQNLWSDNRYKNEAARQQLARRDRPTPNEGWDV